MKILFEDLAIAAAITSVNESPNYPAANLSDFFMRKRYQNLAGVDVVTMVLPRDSTVNCFFCGYHNAREAYRLTEAGVPRITEAGLIRTISVADLTLRLYDYTGALLYTEVLRMTSQFEAVYFADVEMVRSATLTFDWAGVGAGYLGGAGFGEVFEMPGYMLADWGDDLEDNTIVSESSEGQILQDYNEPRIVRAFNFINVHRDDYVIIKNYLYNLGRMRPLWVDFTEGDHDKFLPGYCSIVDGIEDPLRTPSQDIYSFRLTFKEAR